MDPVKIRKLRAPARIGARVEAWGNQKKEGNLSPEEALERDRYLSLDVLKRIPCCMMGACLLQAHVQGAGDTLGKGIPFRYPYV